ncbi:AMP-binding enzyme C-terminal domain [Popillia japonica]|uniref:AMP-binding enzyme C-terminal domain n=1 Tax=Popillia japonica TaxID=7064 RepID=A0AAW1MTM8_POPJA
MWGKFMPRKRQHSRRKKDYGIITARYPPLILVEKVYQVKENIVFLLHTNSIVFLYGLSNSPTHLRVHNNTPFHNLYAATNASSTDVSMSVVNFGYFVQSATTSSVEVFIEPQKVNFGYFVQSATTSSVEVFIEPQKALISSTRWRTVIIYRVDEHTDESITYHDLTYISQNLSTALSNLNFRRNDQIAICSKNSIYYFCPILSALYLGLITAPICEAYLDEELRNTLVLTQVRIIFCSRSKFRQFVRLRAQLPFIEHIVILDFGETEDGVETLRTFMEMYARNEGDLENFPIVNVNVNDQVAFIIFSSGTADLPKGAMLTHKNIITSIIHLTDPNLRFGNPLEPFLCIVPNAHIFGLITTTEVAIIFRTKRSYFRPDHNDRKKYQISRLNSIPTLVVLLAKSPLVEKYNLSALKEISYVIGVISENTERLIKERLSVTNIRQMYGITETTSITISVPALTEKRGSVGKVLPTMSVLIRDPDSGESLGANQLGEICFKGDLIMKGYYRNPTATKNIFIEDGWLRTGDLGYFDEDEYFFVVDRLTELIKYRGYQVPPGQLESILLRHPAVRECGVVGMPDEEFGELPMAFVVRQSGVDITERELIDYVAANVSNEKQLRGGVRFIEHMPKNATVIKVEDQTSPTYPIDL